MRWSALLLWPVAAACFGFVYLRLERTARAEGLSLADYLDTALADVRWVPWVSVMVPYCLLYLVLDTALVWRVVGWSLTPVRYGDIFPVRAAGYVLSLINEQVGKGGIAVVLHRRHGVPLTAAASSMAFIAVGEYLSLLTWATAGVLLQGDRVPAAFDAVPWLAAGSLVIVVAGHLAATRVPAGRRLCQRRPLLRAFGTATVGRYAEVLAWRAPLMATAVIVYTASLRMFGVPVSVGQMVGLLPVVLLGAATPGPLRSVAVVLWVVLLPEYPARMAAFGLLQHTLFILVNALIGAAFLGRATRELRAGPRAGPAPAPPSTPRS